MSDPRLIIFDLDGTLLDTLESLALAFNRSLVDMNCAERSVAEYKRIVGDGALVAVRRCLPDERQRDNDIQRCAEMFRKHYAENWQTASPYPGITALLSTLKTRTHLAVLSNKDEQFTEQCVQHFFPDDFDLVVGHSEFVKHKPDPSGASKIMQALKVTADETWMVGDTAADMRTAVACKMTGVGVLWGFRDQQELADSGAQYIIQSPHYLLDLIPDAERH